MSTPSRALPLSLGILFSGALALTALSARSQTPPAADTASPTASTSASADPSASPSASASASAGAQPGGIKGADIPTEVSKPPEDKKDWEPGAEVIPDDGPFKDCVFKRVREWLRIECTSRIGGALVAGEPADVKVWSWGDPMAGLPGAAEARHVPAPMTVIVLPLRRGESYVLDLDRVEEGWDWVGPSRAERISVAWRGSDPDPVILISGRI